MFMLVQMQLEKMLLGHNLEKEVTQMVYVEFYNVYPFRCPCVSDMGHCISRLDKWLLRTAVV